MRASRGMGCIRPELIKSRGVAKGYAKGGESRVNAAGNYTKPGMRKSLFESIKSKANGRPVRPSFWPSSTRRKAGATSESPPKVPEGLDRTEMADQVREAVIKDGGEIPPGSSDQCFVSC